MKKNTKSPTVPNVKGKSKKKKFVKKNKFWVSKPGAKIPFLIDPSKLSNWLEIQGYCSISSFGDIQIVKLEENIAYARTAMQIYNDALAFVKEQQNEQLETCFRMQGDNLLLQKKGTLGTLPKLTLNKYIDNNNVVRIFFKNGIAELSKKEVKMVSYDCLKTLGRYIMSEQIVQREFTLNKKTKGDFKKFISKITNSEQHFLSVCTAIGYAISSYKNPSQAKALIVTDILSQVKNEAYGRSGKGIIIKAISYIINVVEYNGKVTDLTNDKFVFQNVDITTALIVLQDVTKGFVFESLFSTLTDKMSVERKHRSKISIAFEDSPKIALTTNYTIPQDTDSFKDRKHLMMLNNHFNAQNKPEKYFKTLLFDWSEKEWKRFDNFMLECVRLFLEHGLVKYSDKKFELQRLINQTSKEFVELMEDGYSYYNNYFSIKEVAKSLDLGTIEKSLKSRKVSGWIDEYASHKGYQVEKRKNGGIIQICFKPRPG